MFVSLQQYKAALKGNWTFSFITFGPFESLLTPFPYIETEREVGAIRTEIHC